MDMTRREALTAAVGAAAWLCCPEAEALSAAGGGRNVRHFHYSVDGALIDSEPDMLSYLRASGVTDVWLGWAVGGPLSDETIARFGTWVWRIEAAGLAAHLITVPLGHPGPGPAAPKFPVEGHWGVRPDGTTSGGTAYHPRCWRRTCRRWSGSGA